MKNLSLAHRAAVAALLVVAGGAAEAQNWKPTRPINLIVPGAPRRAPIRLSPDNTLRRQR